MPSRAAYAIITKLSTRPCGQAVKTAPSYAIITKLSTRPCGQAVKTAPSHGAIPGSIPGKVTINKLSGFFPLIFCCGDLAGRGKASGGRDRAAKCGERCTVPSPRSLRARQRRMPARGSIPTKRRIRRSRRIPCFAVSFIDRRYRPIRVRVGLFCVGGEAAPPFRRAAELKFSRNAAVSRVFMTMRRRVIGRNDTARRPLAALCKNGVKSLKSGKKSVARRF